MKTVGIIIALLVALAAGVSFWHETIGPGGAPGRVEAGKAKPADFIELCANAVQLKRRFDPAWVGARAYQEPASIQRSQRPQEVTCSARLMDGTRIAFQARIFCGEGVDCVNVL